MNISGLFLSRKRSNNVSAKLHMDELYLIALVIDVDPCEVCKDVKLVTEN